MKNYLIILFFSFTSLFAGTINIATAANVSYAIHELINEFHKQHPDTNIQTTLGSSGKLTAQIQNGAPYDVFLSADMKYPHALYKSAFAITQPLIYAKGALAMLSTKQRDFSKGIFIVTDKNIRRIAIANPKSAPYGKAAVEALKNAKLYTKIKNKLIYAESASQALAYSITAADLGFIAKSALFSPKMKAYKKGINYAEVDPDLYTPISQGVVLLKHAKKSADAKAFYRFILSKEAKAIFTKYGYQLP